MLTPLDIQRQTFNKTLRGYDPDEVRQYLSQLSQLWAQMQEENRNLRAQLEIAQKEISRYKEMEDLMRHTLRQAEEVAQKTFENAKQQAEAEIQKAQQQAQEILRETEKKRQEIALQIQQLTQRKNDLILEWKTFLVMQLEKLDQFQGRESPPPPTPPKTSVPSWIDEIARRL